MGESCQTAGYDLSIIPAIVVALGSDTDRLEKQLVENLPREDMSPLDTARALQALLDKGISKNALAKRLGRSAAWIRKMVDLLDSELAEKVEQAGVDLDGLSIEEMRRLRDGGEEPVAGDEPAVAVGAPVATGDEPVARWEPEVDGGDEPTSESDPDDGEDDPTGIADRPPFWVGADDEGGATVAPPSDDAPEILRVSLPMALRRALLEKAGIDGEPTESAVIAALEQWV